MRFYLKKTATFIFTLAFIAFIVPISASAVMYQPGETLNPSCLPTDISCGVVVVVGNGVAGQIPYYNSAGNILTATSSVFASSTGNIGIGTITPGWNLDVAGSAAFAGNLLTQMDGGTYFGRNKISENQWGLSGVGENWTGPNAFASTSDYSWYNMAISSDGKYQSAIIYTNNSVDCHIYTSSDYGATWTQRIGGDYTNYNYISMSSDGKYQTAVNTGPSYSGYIYTSSDYGVTWTQKGDPTYWQAVSMSSDGKYQVATQRGGYIYSSSDYGVTWNQGGISGIIYEISLSSDGKYQTTISGNGTNDKIYTSSDYGATWQTVDSDGGWISAMSSNGKYQAVVKSENANDHIYTSSDYGANWTQRGVAKDWGDIAISSDGKYMVAIAYGDYIYISSDYGVTWTPKENSRQWWTVAMSSDGKYITAGSNEAGLYKSIANSYIDGNVGIGTTTPNARFAVSGNGTGTGKAFIVTDSNSSEKLTLLDNGNLGISSSTPTYPLSMLSGAHVTVGGTWTDASSRDLKENFAELNKQEILQKINNLSITKWNYKNEATSTMHIGPVAEDFFDIFNLGGTNKSIAALDTSGLALLGVQALSENASSTEIRISKIESLLSLSNNFASSISSLSSSVSEWIGEKITVTTGIFKNIFTDSLNTKNINIEDGIQIKDKGNGSIYCVTLLNGEWQKEIGECNSVPVVNSNTNTDGITENSDNQNQNIIIIDNNSSTTTIESTSQDLNAVQTILEPVQTGSDTVISE